LKYLLPNIILILLFLNVDYEGDRLGLQKKEQANIIRDSITIWIDGSKNKTISLQKRKKSLDKAYLNTLKEGNDSLKNSYLLKIAFAYSKLSDSLAFRKVNAQSIKLSIKLNDSSRLADNYWDLGRFYSVKGVNDSAYLSYSKAQKIYESLRNNNYSGRMLLYMAIMQSDLKDYTGSEITTIKAISLLKPLNQYVSLYRCYNNLGINFNNLGDYDEAIFYHNKALNYEEKIKGKNMFKENTLNNIGVVYRNKKEYKKAINYYQLSLKEGNLKQTNPKLYAKLLGNLAYSLFKLGDTTGVKELFFKSQNIRDSIQDHLGIAINKLHLAEYYVFNKDTLKAIQFAKESKQLAATTNNNRELLAALLLLAKLDEKNSNKYTDLYIKLSDSLQKQERAIRNKFARIRFETDEFIDENKRLDKQRKLLLGVAGLVTLFGLLLYIITLQRSRNKQLKFDQQQQLVNEEIYNLMLTQQTKLDEARRKEKKRISEELHDGVLGKLFATRLLLGSLNDKTDVETIEKRDKYINELQEVEEDVRNVSHELNNKSLFSEIGFIQMVEKLLELQSSITNFKHEVAYDDKINWEKINASTKMNLYRIIQEAIQNINKYANAKHVSIKFDIDSNDELSLSIKDDGIGFNAAQKSNGIGLKNIKSRVQSLNGEVFIESASIDGTSVNVKIPV